MRYIIDKLKNDTNNLDRIIYRKKTLLYKTLYIIYDETLSSSDKISDFVIRSLNNINIPTYKNIINRISNFKYKEISTYEDVCYYINNGFTIIIYGKNKYIALETKKNLSRGINTPVTENTSRGALDAFSENIEINIGLIRRRIKSNDLWINDYKVGKYTKTIVNVLYIKSIANIDTVNKLDKLIKNINIDGILSNGNLRNLIEDENENIFPNILTAEKPYTVAKYLLKGYVVIGIDNDPFFLIIPANINDYFISEEDDYNKSKNVTVTRLIRYTAFFITLLTPSLYLALTTYNQEIIPTELLTSIAAQRESVPFSTFMECFLMIAAFEILRESDLKIPSFANSALSIVGALILGEAAVSAGIVSPIMIIVVAITAISSLIFTEPEFINALRLYRLLFMIGASVLGIYGVLLSYIYMLINLASYECMGVPYLSPFAPVIWSNLKDSFFRSKYKNINTRNELISKNTTMNKTR